MSVDACFMIAGEAGQGLQSIGQILARTLARGGFHVFVDQDYESRVRGGHNFVRVRASDSEIRAVSEVVNVLIALNAESIDLHLAEVSTDGVVARARTRAATAICSVSPWKAWRASGAATSAWPIRWPWELPWAWSGMTWGRSAMCCGSISGAETAVTPT